MAELDHVRRQLWQQVPLRELSFDAMLLVGPDSQDWLLCNALSMPTGYPIDASYQRLFLKKLLAICQEQAIEPVESIYEYYVGLLGEGTDCRAQLTAAFSYKTYVCGSLDRCLTLRESRSMVSDGTTGLRAWEAAAALSEWVVSHPEPLDGQVLLELGAGPGLVGLVAWLTTSARVVLTDVHEAVLDNLAANARLNAELCAQAGKPRPPADTAVLDWLQPDRAWLESIDPSMVLGTDLVYDVAIVPALVELLRLVLSLPPTQTCPGPRHAYIASTCRNEATLAVFLDALAKANFCVESLELSPSRQFYWPPSSTVLLHHLTIAAESSPSTLLQPSPP